MSGRQTLGLHLILATGLSAGLLLLGVGALLFGPLLLRMSSAPLDGDEAHQVGQRLLFLHTQFWPIAAIAIASAVASTAIVARRLMAPMARLQRIFAAIGAGRLPARVGVRDSDYLVDDVDVLNDMLDGLRGRIREIRSAAREIDLALEAVEKAEPGSGVSEPEAFARIRTHQRELEIALRAFQIDD